jgi:hypothetical protein
MAKNSLQDINTNKRSIRDISMPSRRAVTSDIVKKPKEKSPTREIKREVNKEIERPAVKNISRPVEDRDEYNFDYDIDRPTREKRWGLWSLIAIFFVAVAFGIVSMFASASVVVVPKTQTIPLKITLSASKDQPAGQFGYQVVSISSSVDKQVDAGVEKQTDTKSTGTIAVFNSSNTVQNLIVNTRFETPSGLIFRLAKSVSVPKATVQNKQTVPGSVMATVVADKSGDAYNVDLSDFTLPGLKNSPQYKNVYARSKTAMTGGFSGMMKSVDPAVLKSATDELQTSLKADLQSKITSQIPSNFILYPQSVSFNLAEVSQKSDVSTGKATLTESGTASAVIFDSALLSQAVISAVSGQLVNQGQAEVKNLSSLNFSMVQPPAISKDYTGGISFELSGDVNVSWLFDAVSLKSDLLGLKKTNLNPLLQAKYPTISEVKAKIFPVWKTSFPSDPNKIDITQNN